MKSFLTFFEAADESANLKPKRLSDDIVTTFGRHNPPHIGHKLGLDLASDKAASIGDGDNPADQRFYTSRSFDPKKNPLPYQLKLDHLKRMFPDHKDKWDDDPKQRTILNAATKAHGEGYKNFHFVGGGDRQQPMEDLLRKYNGELYDFDNIYSHSAGDRVQTGDMLQSMSASKQRGYAQKDDFDKFNEGILQHKGYTIDDAKELFKALQMYGQKNEEYEPEVLRDKYTLGEIFQMGEMVESLHTGLRGYIHRRGTNHLICVTEDGIMFKNFIHDVQAV